MENINLELKAELIRRRGSCVNVADEIGMRPSRLSLIIHRHVKPNEEECRAIGQILGDTLAKKLLNVK